MHRYLRHLPNLISFARIIMVVPIVWLLLERRFEPAIWLFVIAGASDGLDGFLAKRFGWSSRFGGILDALADKILLLSTFTCLWWLDVFPWWLLALILLRDLLIFGGGTYYNFHVERFYPEPSYISKISTFLQIMLAALGVLHLGLGMVPLWVIDTLVVAVVITVVLSGAGYVQEWSRRAARGTNSGQ